MADRRTWARRLIMPLAILVVAAGVAFWSSRQQQQQTEQVRRWADTLCDDLEAGRDPRPRLKTDELLAGRVAAQLRAVADRAAARPGALSVIVTGGDTDEAGTAAREATHTAVIRVDGAPVLGLRLIHEGDGNDIAIIGFWTP